MATTPMDGQARLAALRRVEDEILRVTQNAFERVVFLAPDMTVLYVVDGDVGQTYLEEEDVAWWFGRVDVITHNHPRQTSFTDSDVFSAIALDARELHAFGGHIRYRLVRKPGGSGWPPRADVEAAIRGIDEALRPSIVPRVARGELSPLAAEALHRRLRWAAFARRFADGVDYVEERR